MTNINPDKELITELWATFSDSKISTINPIPIGFKNLSNLIETKSKEKYVLKIYALNFLNDEVIENDVMIVNYLGKKSIPVIEFLIGKNGKYVQSINYQNQKYQATCSKYYETSIFKSESLNKKKVSSLAKFLGHLHLALSEFDLKGEMRKLEPIKVLNDLTSKNTIKEIHRYFERNRHNQKHIDKFVKEYLREAKVQIDYFPKILNNGLRVQLIHGDFNLSNISFKDDKIEALFDYDEITYAPVSFEIGCTLVHLDEGFMLLEDLVEYFIKSYQKYNPAYKKLDVKASLMFMRYRALYRIGRYFTYYRYLDRPVEHYTKYQYKLEKYQKLFL